MFASSTGEQLHLLLLAPRVVEGPNGEMVHEELGVALELYEYEVIFYQL